MNPKKQDSVPHPPPVDALHNMRVNVIDVAFYHFAASLVSIPVMLPLFGLQVGTSELVLGALPALATVAMGLPGFFAAFFVQRLRRTMPYLTVLGVIQRLPWLVLTVAVPLLWARPAALAMLMPAAFMVSWVTIGFVRPAWASLIHRGLHAGSQGRFRGNLQFWGSALAILGALLLAWVFHGGKPNGPMAWTTVFAMATAGVFVSFVFFLRNRERPVLQPPGPPPSFRHHLAWGWKTLTTDVFFRRLLLLQVLTLSSTALQGRILLDAVNHHGAGPRHAGIFAMLLTAGTGLTALFIGPLSDRRGPHATYGISALASALAVAIAFVAPNLWFSGLALMLFAVHQSAFQVSSDNLVFRNIPSSRIPSYLGLLYSVASPLILGWSLLLQKLIVNPAVPRGLLESLVVGANIAAFFIARRMSPGATRP